MRIRGYLYPWDVIGDPVSVQQMADAGLGEVALAAAYHSVRAATPRHPEHRVVEAADAALYLPVRAQAWPPRWRPVQGEYSYLAAAEILSAAGIRVTPWVVLTHNSQLGRRHPEAVTTNMFGDHYSHALCPNAPGVADYVRTLVDQVLAATGADAIVLESLGPAGYAHAAAHEKTEADLSAAQLAALGVCLCRWCRADYAHRGVDFDRQVSQPNDLMVPAEPLVRAVRAGAITRLWQAIDGELRRHRVRDVALHATSVPERAGAAVDAGLLDAIDPVDLTWIAPCWGPVADAAADVAALARGGRAGAYVNLLAGPIPSIGAQAASWAALADAGARELHLYHLGLASQPRFHTALAAIGQLQHLAAA